MAVPGDPFGSLEGLNREELQQRLQALRALIAHAPVPIAIAHDRNCQLISANRALADLLGVPPGSNVSLTPQPGERPLYRIQRDGRDLLPDELPMQYSIAQRTPVKNEIEIVRSDGTVLYVQNDVEPLYDTQGEIYGCVSVCVDLTARKLAEAALRDADRRKDEFLATLSHELRNPLAPIRTALELMRLARGDADLVEKARLTMERQLMHLVRITDDLLDVSRITQNKVELRRERIDLRSVVHSALESTRPLIDAQAQLLSLDLPRVPIWVQADFTRLLQVFSNLLNNATKYTERGGHIHVTAFATAADQAATVVVSDTGQGIPQPMLERIFDMFTQVQEFRDRTQGGLGIGLTLAKRLIELHGGTIEARSEGPGQGSVFTVRIPVSQAVDAYAVPAPGSLVESSVECRVLIAEDNPDAAEMMRMMLTFKGHDVRVATNGLQAVAVAEQFDPHIGFLDIGMPGMDGYEAARRIRDLLGRRIVLVALTGWGQDEDKRRSREAGFDHHLTKPPEPDMLERLIADCASGGR
jgi:signal transduction histidine kinase